MDLLVYGMSDVGRHRTHNEDTVAICERLGIAVDSDRDNDNSDAGTELQFASAFVALEQDFLDQQAPHGCVGRASDEQAEAARAHHPPQGR